jgi:Sulfotransferase domain
MAFNFEIIDHPKIKTISEQQSNELYTDYCWVSPKEIPTTPLGVDWKPKPSVMVPLYETHADRIKNFEVRPDDIWLISYPKTGTTWSQEMVWCICNNLDYKKAKELNLFARFPFIE